jgi:hypothetical protein
MFHDASLDPGKTPVRHKDHLTAGLFRQLLLKRYQIMNHDR